MTLESPTPDPTPATGAPRPPDPAHDRKTLEVFIDLQWKGVALVLDVLAKGVSFYFLIVVMAVGLIHQAKLPAEQARGVAGVVVAITLIVGVLVAGGIVLMLRGLAAIKATLQVYNGPVFTQALAGRGFVRTRRYGLAGLVLCLAVIGLIAAVVALVLVPEVPSAGAPAAPPAPKATPSALGPARPSVGKVDRSRSTREAARTAPPAWRSSASVAGAGEVMALAVGSR